VEMSRIGGWPAAQPADQARPRRPGAQAGHEGRWSRP
jgi:hypothetical protein